MHYWNSHDGIFHFNLHAQINIFMLARAMSCRNNSTECPVIFESKNGSSSKAPGDWVMSSTLFPPLFTESVCQPISKGLTPSSMDWRILGVHNRLLVRLERWIIMLYQHPYWTILHGHFLAFISGAPPDGTGAALRRAVTDAFICPQGRK